MAIAMRKCAWLQRWGEKRRKPVQLAPAPLPPIISNEDLEDPECREFLKLYFREGIAAVGRKAEAGGHRA